MASDGYIHLNLNNFISREKFRTPHVLLIFSLQPQFFLLILKFRFKFVTVWRNSNSSEILFRSTCTSFSFNCQATPDIVSTNLWGAPMLILDPQGRWTCFPESSEFLAFQRFLFFLNFFGLFFLMVTGNFILAWMEFKGGAQTIKFTVMKAGSNVWEVRIFANHHHHHPLILTKPSLAYWHRSLQHQQIPIMGTRHLPNERRTTVGDRSDMDKSPYT